MTDPTGMNSVCLKPDGLQLPGLVTGSSIKGEHLMVLRIRSIDILLTNNLYGGAGSFWEKTIGMYFQLVQCVVLGHTIHHQEMRKLQHSRDSELSNEILRNFTNAAQID